MLNIVITFLILSSLCLSNFQDGMNVFNQRAVGNEGAKVPSENINKAINLFEQALNEDQNEETVVMLLRSYYYKGKFVNGDENFKKNAMDGLIEVEFSLEEDGELFIHEEGFVKDNDGQTELFVD